MSKELLNALKELVDSQKFVGEYGDWLIDVEYINKFIEERLG